MPSTYVRIYKCTACDVVFEGKDVFLEEAKYEQTPKEHFCGSYTGRYQFGVAVQIGVRESRGGN